MKWILIVWHLTGPVAEGVLRSEEQCEALGSHHYGQTKKAWYCTPLRRKAVSDTMLVDIEKLAP